MRKFVAAALFVGLSFGLAHAADLPTQKSPPPFIPPEPILLWNGPYVGVNAGAAISDSPFAYGLGSIDQTAFIGGATLGYNMQVAPTLLAGLEADADYRGEFSSVHRGLAFASQTNDGYVGTVRARVGYVGGPWLLYATGGYAFGNVIAPRQVFTAPFAAARSPGNDTFLSGWAAGAGVEYMLWNNWSVKMEYLYFRLKHEFPQYNTTTAGIYAVGLPAGSAAHVARAGVSYHFNWAAPPVLAKF